jgi:hypothetical protein
MRLKIIIFLFCIISCITISGCTNEPDDKKAGTIAYVNEALNATIAVWNSSGQNSTIDNSSAGLIYVNSIGNNTTISTIQFNTTDGKTHTSNLTNYNYKNPIVTDIDNVPVSQMFI